MKKVVISIIGFAIAIALIVSVIIPIANNGKTTGQTAKNNHESVDTSITSIQTVVD